jgi:hypothetical protein
MLLTMTFIALTLGHTAANQDTLRDRVRNQGDVSASIHVEYEPATTEDLVRSADLIALVLIQGEKPSLSQDGTKVVTDYEVQVLDPIRRRRAASHLPPVITIRKQGGTVALEGHKVHFFENDFPPLELGVEYIVFIKREADGSFSFPYGGQSAFRLDGQTVDQVSRRRAVWQREHGGKPVQADVLLQEVAAAAGPSGKQE